MKHDAVDELVGDWQAERPDLNPRPMAVVGRILRLAVHLEGRANEILPPLRSGQLGL